MLYGAIKQWVRLAMPFFAPHIRREPVSEFDIQGPALIAANHPNSFLDALLIGLYTRQPVHYLARGDVFRKPWIRKLLGQFHMIPIYRLREGKENLHLNADTFDRSVEVLQAGGLLLIFVEGFCINQTELQLPLKKGAPRILHRCWQSGCPVRVVPAWLRYSSFSRYGKRVALCLGPAFGQEILQGGEEPAQAWSAINERTALELDRLQRQCATVPAASAKPWLWLPAIIGAVLHAPLYLPAQAIVRHATRDNPHYDSVLLLVLMVFYPIYWLLACWLAYALGGTWPALLVALLLPLTARAFVLWKTGRDADPSASQ